MDVPGVGGGFEDDGVCGFEVPARPGLEFVEEEAARRQDNVLLGVHGGDHDVALVDVQGDEALGLRWRHTHSTLLSAEASVVLAEFGWGASLGAGGVHTPIRAWLTAPSQLSGVGRATKQQDGLGVPYAPAVGPDATRPSVRPCRLNVDKDSTRRAPPQLHTNSRRQTADGRWQVVRRLTQDGQYDWPATPV